MAEFSSLSWIAGTRGEALEGLTELVADVLEDMAAEGEMIPAPWGERKFSGKFNVHLGSDLHKKVALMAAERNESMNTFVFKQLGRIDADKSSKVALVFMGRSKVPNALL